MQTVKLTEEDVRPHDIMVYEAFENATRARALELQKYCDINLECLCYLFNSFIDFIADRSSDNR